MKGKRLLCFGLMGRLDVDGALPQRLFQFDDEGWAGDRDLCAGNFMVFDCLYKGFRNHAIIGRGLPEEPRFAFFLVKNLQKIRIQ